MLRKIIHAVDGLWDSLVLWLRPTFQVRRTKEKEGINIERNVPGKVFAGNGIWMNQFHPNASIGVASISDESN